MKRIIALSLFAALSTTQALAAVEMELSAGPSTKKIKGEEGEKDSSISSTDLSLYVGYRFKFVSFGLIATQKNYDLKLNKDDVAPISDTFYNDPDSFPSPPTRSSEKVEGTLKGLVFGPQLTFAASFKYFQPFFRINYQMGTLKNLIEYSSVSDYSGVPITYNFSLDDERKATFTQIGVGFRIPISMTYILVEYAMESMTLKTDSTNFKQSATVGTDEFEGQNTITETVNDKGGGGVAKVGIGFSF